MCSALQPTKCLVMFSGGRDSILSACKVCTDGYHPVLISFTNGCISGEQYFGAGAQQLISRFGKHNMEFAGVYSHAACLSKLREHWVNSRIVNFSEKYPDLTPCQLDCLHCQSAMWCAAIAYAVAHEIQFIACGYRRTDVFCTGLQEYVEEIRTVALKYRIAVITPVWGLMDDYSRNRLIAQYSLTTKVLEPQCMIGCPPPADLKATGERVQLMDYFTGVIVPKMEEEIGYLTRVFEHIDLSHSVPTWISEG